MLLSLNGTIISAGLKGLLLASAHLGRLCVSLGCAQSHLDDQLPSKVLRLHGIMRRSWPRAATPLHRAVWPIRSETHQANNTCWATCSDEIGAQSWGRHSSPAFPVYHH